MSDEKEGAKVIVLMGRRVDLSKIQNPVLRRVIRDNNIEDFLFSYGDSYGDHSKYNVKWTEYNDWRKTVYHERWSEKYSDYRVYGDYWAGS